jgi:hypothetical protein
MHAPVKKILHNGGREKIILISSNYKSKFEN